MGPLIRLFGSILHDFVPERMYLTNLAASVQRWFSDKSQTDKMTDRIRRTTRYSKHRRPHSTPLRYPSQLHYATRALTRPNGMQSSPPVLVVGAGRSMCGQRSVVCGQGVRVPNDGAETVGHIGCEFLLTAWRALYPIPSSSSS